MAALPETPNPTVEQLRAFVDALDAAEFSWLSVIVNQRMHRDYPLDPPAPASALADIPPPTDSRH